MKLLFGFSKFHFYKKYNTDIWSFIRSSLRITKEARVLFFFVKERRLRRRGKLGRYIYHISVPKRRRSNRRFNLKFSLIRILLLFFLVLSKSKFINLLSLSFKKSGQFISNYLLALEGRLYMFLRRIHFILNPFNVLYYLRTGVFNVDKRMVTFGNYSVKLGSILHLNPRMLKKFKFYLKRNFRWVFCSVPRSIYVNFKFYFALFYKYPQKTDFSYIRQVDIMKSFDLGYF